VKSGGQNAQPVELDRRRNGSMTPHLEGIVVPLLTPFRADNGDLDEAALRRLVDRLIPTGVQGLIVNAATSEFFHLDEAERRRAAEIVVEQAAGRIPVLAGCGAPGTRLSIAAARHAQSIGAVGLLMMPPYYVPLSVDQVLGHYVAVSDSVSIPIMLYNNPFVSGVLLGPDDLVRFVTQANIPWIKLTTQHVEHVPAILDRVGERASVFEGVDSLAFPSMVNGSVGWIAGPANAIPEHARELWRLTREDRDWSAAYSLHRRLVPLLDFLWNEGVFQSSLKEICGLRGYPLGAVRAPFRELNPALRARVHEFARSLDLVEAAAALA
jgi:4-hydroxy-tetrahydrodipicolinate synthase